jgi:hypothetical protein
MFLAGVSVVPAMLTDVGIVWTLWEVLQQRPVDGRRYQWRLQIIAPQCNERHILVFRLSPCCWCRVYSFGCNSSVWIKWVDVSEPGISSIFLDSYALVQEDGTDTRFRKVDSLNSDAGVTPKEYTLHQQHGESLKTRILFFIWEST